MSLLDKLKGMGQRRQEGDLADEVSYVDAYSILDDPSEIRDTVQEPMPALMSHAQVDVPIISESAPSDGASQFLTPRVPAPAPQPAAELPGSGVQLPLIGKLPSARQQRLLAGLLAVGVLGLVLASVLAVRSAGGSAGQIGATGQALMQSQRLTRAVMQAMVGQPAAFAEVRGASEGLSRTVRGLIDGASQPGVESAPLGARSLLEPLLPRVEQTDQNARTLLAQEAALTQADQTLRRIRQQSTDWFEAAQAVAAAKAQQNAPAAEVLGAGQLLMLTQRIGRSASESLTLQGVSTDAVLLLGKDLGDFHDLAAGLLDGSAEARLTASRDAAVRERLQGLLKSLEPLRAQAAEVVGHLQGLSAARDAQAAIVTDGETLRAGLEAAQASLSSVGGMGWFNVTLIGGSLLLGLLGGLGLLAVFTHDQRQRALMSDGQRHEAERQERDAKRVNDANQAAILRLMNELQSVAEGDLTQQATVTEDITGAIADSVNYTVEELRSLVSQVQGTAARVTDTTQQVEATSTELLAASDEQLREIRETGEAVLQMAGRIQRVSGQAQQSADVARDSLAAATSGLTAVLDTITGMNTLRDQIQETSKRIKRLGESSQEIGEITELISDITEQTNVLALNAAIQAASAGEAGRGFSVVAEEVQRLAERSGDATRAIAVLVKTIQTDTADAVAAMERSTQGVVEGAKLSDNAGTALAEIDRVSRQLAELIEEISAQARREAESATVVAQNIQHIFAVTEQTGDGTRSTAQLVRQLSRIAEELRQSVARFKIS
ncbi:MAG: methyl-accepting chemotaxis protein [Leptothrix sp. (in: b-proteobacteria)]